MALRSGFEFALPLAGFDSGEDRRGQQDAKYRAWAHQFSAMLGEGERRHGLRVLHAGGGISEDEATALVLGEASAWVLNCAGSQPAFASLILNAQSHSHAEHNLRTLPGSAFVL